MRPRSSSPCVRTETTMPSMSTCTRWVTAAQDKTASGMTRCSLPDSSETRQLHWQIHDRRELDFLRSAGSRGHGAIGGRSCFALTLTGALCACHSGTIHPLTTRSVRRPQTNDHKYQRNWRRCDAAPSCLAEDSDITASFVDDAVVLSRCKNLCFSSL